MEGTENINESKQVYLLSRLKRLEWSSLGNLALPVVVAIIGAWYNINVKDSENRVRYVELAISQLRTPPSAETSALRSWAVELLDNQAPIKLSPEAKRQLMLQPLSIQLSGSAVVQATASGDLTSVRGANGGESQRGTRGGGK
jgi:hypothetical protein